MCVRILKLVPSILACILDVCSCFLSSLHCLMSFIYLFEFLTTGHISLVFKHEKDSFSTKMNQPFSMKFNREIKTFFIFSLHKKKETSAAIKTSKKDLQDDNPPDLKFTP